MIIMIRIKMKKLQQKNKKNQLKFKLILFCSLLLHHKNKLLIFSNPKMN